MLDDEYYNNSDYISAGGPPELTIENYCDYNGYDLSWCDQSYLDYLNEWYADDWSLFKDYTSWEKGAKKLFKKWYGWCGQWPDYEWCEGQPKPWKIDGLKDKYISEWDWNDWDKFYQATYDCWYTGTYDDSGDDQSSWEEEYEYEDEYDADLELEQWLSDLDNEWDCDYYGYYWDKANQKCGTEWVDNSQAETAITTSGETNFPVLNLLKLMRKLDDIQTDFNSGIDGVGPKRGLKLVQEFGKAEGALEKLGKEIKKDVLDYVQGKQFVKKRKREILGVCWKRFKSDVSKDINRIVEGTDDWIMKRDPDNLYVYDDGKTIYDDDLTKEQLIDEMELSFSDDEIEDIFNNKGEVISGNFTV